MLRLFIFGLLFAASTVAPAQDHRFVLPEFLNRVPAAKLVEGATAYGAMRADSPVAPIFKDGEMLGHAFVTSDFVGTTGYSGKPIHVMVAVAPDGKLLQAKLVEHAEPIVLTGIPNHKIEALTGRYAGFDLVAEARSGGSERQLDIISGATVTVMVIADSIIRSGLKVARRHGLGGLTHETPDAGPRYALNPEEAGVDDWAALATDGSVRRLSLDVGQINRAFARHGDERAIKRPEPGDAGETYIDMQAALISVPVIGRSLLGDDEYRRLRDWLEEGEHAILLAGRGRYSFKGSGYVRGGIFDRIQLIQGDASVRFFDRGHRRLGDLAADGAPTFSELDIFKIPADVGFDPTLPWRIQLLVNRAVGAVEKSFLTFDLGYNLPSRFLIPVAAAVAAPPGIDAGHAELWKQVWWQRRVEIGVLFAMLAVLTGVFFFQKQVTRYERGFFWFRMAFLSLTLLFLGWGQNAQLSIVNLMALGASLTSGFTWDAFLLDPLIFILWFSVATVLLFWGRGAFCGWLCPFGALQELTNRIARFFRVPQVTVPWGLHERLWPIKYILFLSLLGLSLVSITLAERYAEIEPFKTAIVLKFDRSWPYILFVGVLLGAGLFIERFYCRYLCALGAALAIPGRLRMFDWLKRYRVCGDPCQICASECMVQSIHPTGEINPNECLSCLHCQIRYQDEHQCPVAIKQRKRRERLAQYVSPPQPAADPA